MGLEQYIHPGRLEQQAGPGGVAALPSGEGRGETEHPCCPSAPSSDFPPRLPRRGPPGAALTGEDPAVPGEKSGPHGEAAVGAVGGLLGLLAGQQQPLDVLGLQGEAGTLLGHVDPPGPAEKRNASSQPVWAGPHRDGSSSPGVCPCREAARCAPLGVLGRAGEGEGWGQKVCVCARPSVDAQGPRVLYALPWGPLPLLARSDESEGRDGCHCVGCDCGHGGFREEAVEWSACGLGNPSSKC